MNQRTEAGQVYDPWVWLGWIAAQTSTIALATGSIILPLRHPLHTAKASASVDQLTGGRFVLGVASGDRPVENICTLLFFCMSHERYLLAVCKDSPLAALEDVGIEGVAWNKEDPTAGRDDIIDIARSLARPRARAHASPELVPH